MNNNFFKVTLPIMIAIFMLGILFGLILAEPGSQKHQTKYVEYFDNLFIRLTKDELSQVEEFKTQLVIKRLIEQQKKILLELEKESEI